MITTGIGAGRTPAEGQTNLRIVEGLQMDTHVNAHMERLLSQAAAERLFAAVAREGVSRRLRRRLGHAVVVIGRAIEGASREPGAATA